MDGGQKKGQGRVGLAGTVELAWWTGGQGGGARAREKVQGLRFRDGPQARKQIKMAFFEGCPVQWGGGTHRSWPGGRGGRPRALIPEKGSGKGWLGGGYPAELAWWTGEGGGARAQGGGARASVPGGRW